MEGAQQTTFASLRYPGAKRYFAGLALSMCGSWFQSIALSWLIVKTLDGGGRELGLQQAFQFGPMLVFGAWAGSVADRIDKRRLMFVTQIVLGLCALTLGVLDLTGRATLPAVLAISLASGLGAAFDTPVRRSLVGDLVPREALANAMALNTGVITSSRVVGMMLGGFLAEAIGTGWCFILNGVSYLAMLFALTGLGVRAHRSPPAEEGSGVADAVRHLWETPALRISALVTLFIATFTFNYGLTLPLIVEEVFGRNADSLGIIMAMVSIGSFLGAMVSARRHRATVGLFLVGGAVMSLGTIGVARSPGFLAAIVFGIPLGFGGGLLMSQGSGMLTSLSPSNMRSRVLALQSVIFIGSTPIGGPIIGWVSDEFGPRAGALLGGLVGLVVVVLGIPAWRQMRSGSRLDISSVQTQPR
jgi:MFS family permease